LLAIHFRQRLPNERGKHCTQAVQTLIVAAIRAELREPLGKVIADVVVDFTDRLSMFDDPEQIHREHFFVGECRIGVIALTLGESPEAALPVVSADEQVNANKRILGVHVAKGGVYRKASSTFFKSPAATWFFQPLIGVSD